MKVGIDLDGVCYDFAASLAEHLRRGGWAGNATPAERWEFYEDWGFSLEQFLTHCHDGVRAGIVFTHGDPYPGTRDGWEAIRAAGHSIHVITDRSFGGPGASEGATLAWLDRHGLTFDSITFAADKTIDRPDVMVDDKPANYRALTAAGVQTWLMDRPWNKHVTDAPRVTDLSHYAEVIA